MSLTDEQIDAAIVQALGKLNVRTGRGYDYEDLHLVARAVLAAAEAQEAKMRESDIKDYLLKQVAARGGIARKVRWEGRNDAPDWFVAIPGLQCFVELKAPGENPTATQRLEHDELRAAEVHVFVIDSFALVDLLLGT